MESLRRAPKNRKKDRRGVVSLLNVEEEEICSTNLKVVLQWRSGQQKSELDVQSHQRLVSCRLVVLELMTFVEDGRLANRTERKVSIDASRSSASSATPTTKGEEREPIQLTWNPIFLKNFLSSLFVPEAMVYVVNTTSTFSSRTSWYPSSARSV